MDELEKLRARYTRVLIDNRFWTAADWRMAYRAANATKDAAENYDVGVAIGNDGFWTGYLAEAFGLPVLNVKMGRRGKGATWQPLEKIRDRDLQEKNVIVFDVDVVTGRTLKRAFREIYAFNPKSIDLLLARHKLEISRGEYEKWERVFTKKPIIEETGRDFLSVDCISQAPSGFGRVRSFKEYSEDSVAYQEFRRLIGA